MSSPTARGSAAAALSAPVFPSVETEARLLHTNKPGTEGRAGVPSVETEARLHTLPARDRGPHQRRRYSLAGAEAAPLHTNKPGTEGRISAGVSLGRD